jgi:hypothetical protein
MRTLIDGATTSGSVVTFDCSRGYELMGAQRLICRQGSWGGPWPRCSPSLELAMCGDPGKIFHVFGWRFVEGTREGATVTYSCVKGLVLVDGDEVRTCLSTGEWSGQLPRCTVVNCNPPAQPRHGTVSLPNVGYSYTATYSCDPGHVLEGASEVTCQENGRWSSGPPTCRAVRCRDLPNPRHGSVSHTHPAMYQCKATYRCNTGYGLVGAASSECLTNGSWSNSPPTCEREDILPANDT